MTRIDIQIKIKAIREELEARNKTGVVKMAGVDGVPITAEKLQDEMYHLIYKLSKLD